LLAFIWATSKTGLSHALANKA